MKKVLINMLRGEEGATMVEYGLLLALVAIATVTILGTLGTDLTSLFTKASTEVKKGA